MLLLSLKGSDFEKVHIVLPCKSRPTRILKVLPLSHLWSAMSLLILTVSFNATACPQLKILPQHQKIIEVLQSQSKLPSDERDPKLFALERWDGFSSEEEEEQEQEDQEDDDVE